MPMWACPSRASAAPDPRADTPAGTVYVGWSADGETGSRLLALTGEPEDILDASVEAAVSAPSRAHVPLNLGTLRTASRHPASTLRMPGAGRPHPLAPNRSVHEIAFMSISTSPKAAVVSPPSTLTGHAAPRRAKAM